jgi:hypothetical protein
VGKQKSSPSAVGKSPTAAEQGQQVNGVTWAGDVSPALGSGEPRNAPVMVRIFQGGTDSKEFHF